MTDERARNSAGHFTSPPDSEALLARNRERRSGTYVVTKCTQRCSLSAASLPAGLAKTVHGWFEAGDNDVTIVEKAHTVGIEVARSSVGNHRAKHLQKLYVGIPEVDAPPVERKSDLEVLELVIGRGAEHLALASQRISTEQLLKAIELKHKLTEGSVFESFFGVLEAEGEDAMAANTEVPEAVSSEEEQAQAGPDES